MKSVTSKMASTRGIDRFIHETIPHTDTLGACRCVAHAHGENHHPTIGEFAMQANDRRTYINVVHPIAKVSLTDEYSNAVKSPGSMDRPKEAPRDIDDTASSHRHGSICARQRQQSVTEEMRIGLFGASTGAAAV